MPVFRETNWRGAGASIRQSAAEGYQARPAGTGHRLAAAGQAVRRTVTFDQRQMQKLVAARRVVAASRGWGCAGCRRFRRSSKGRQTVSSSMPRSPPGTRLVREWHGRTHHVDVIEDGFVFEGKTHASLSAIARQITGARWSGPRFFGLNAKGRIAGAMS